MSSKIVLFLWKMDGPSRNLGKANFSSKEKGKQCTAFGCSSTFYGPEWFAYELSLLQVNTRRQVFLLSIYRFILILFPVNRE